MIGNQEQVRDGGTVTLSVKIPLWMADQLNAIARTRGGNINANHLLALCLQFVVESAKHNGPIVPEFQTLLNMLKMDAAWCNAFNFGSTSAQMDVAQCILVLQQHDGNQPRKGFGLMMIDKPFIGESTYTTCVDDILERVAEVSMPGLYKQLRQIGIDLDTQSLRETLTLLCDSQQVENLNNSDKAELPGYGNFHDYGKPIEYGQRTKRKKHRTPDSLANSQQPIRFTDEDKQTAQDELDSGKDMDKEMGFRPFGSEW